MTKKETTKMPADFGDGYDPTEPDGPEPVNMDTGDPKAALPLTPYDMYVGTLGPANKSVWQEPADPHNQPLPEGFGSYRRWNQSGNVEYDDPSKFHTAEIDNFLAPLFDKQAVAMRSVNLNDPKGAAFLDQPMNTQGYASIEHSPLAQQLGMQDIYKLERAPPMSIDTDRIRRFAEDSGNQNMIRNIRGLPDYLQATIINQLDPKIDPAEELVRRVIQNDLDRKRAGS
jgi:hypothetical protein